MIRRFDISKLWRWPRISRRRIRTDGIQGLWWSGIKLYSSIFIDRVDSSLFDRSGRYAFEHDWEVLVVLDACRADLMQEVIEEYDFLSDETAFSNASTSEVWLRRNFSAEYSDELAETAYVSANPFTDSAPGMKRLGKLDEVWRYAWDEDIGTIPPRPVTDRAIDRWRTDAPDRLVIHYMQPHFPALSAPEVGAGFDVTDLDSGWDGSVWDRLERGDILEAEVWDAYVDNLRAVLDDVSLLLRSVDAEQVVITADHGNAVGDRGFYGHKAGIPIRAMREVPWCETTAIDDRSYTPAEYETETEQSDVGNRLSALGYK